MEIQLERLHGEDDFLQLLVSLGQEAARRIKAREKIIEWDVLPSRFFDSQVRPISTSSRGDYERWLRNLSDWAMVNGVIKPEDMSCENAHKACADILGRNISRDRILRFYRRVWKSFAWDSSIWTFQMSSGTRAKEHYRRLRGYEVRRLVTHLGRHDPELKDMVLIGYYTGLRLSDVAELERSEIDTVRHALRIVPNKVRARKPGALTIPLVREAWEAVAARLHGNGYLFTEEVRRRPSRRIVRAFNACRIRKEGQGRASFHSLRATFISLMDEAGVQPYITDAITGHAAGGMHARYTQPSLRVLRSAIMRAIPRIVK